jgi:DNA repair exonuclease SbcCD ATPase subunit
VAREAAAAAAVLATARTQEDACQKASRDQSDRAARSAGAHAALAAEFAELDARRSASIPTGWGARTAFVDAVDPADPRHAARPEIGSLPLIDRTALHVAIEAGETGRGVWERGAGAWVLVDSPDALLEVLETQGPPVALRDGSVQVDHDGVVTLGRTAPPGARWADVREAVEHARVQAEQDAQAAQDARAAAEEARAALDRAQRRKEAADDALEAHRTARRDALRRDAQQAEESRVAAHDAAERAVQSAHREAMADQRQAFAARLDEAVRSGREAVAALQPTPPPIHRVLGAAGRAWPRDRPPRPVASGDAQPAERAKLREAVQQAEAHLEAESTAAREIAERQAAATARQEERVRIASRLEELDAQIEASEPDPQLAAAEAHADEAERTALETSEQLQAAERAAVSQQERQAAEKARRARAVEVVDRARAAVAESRAEIERVRHGADAALAAAEEARRNGERLAVQRAEVEARVAREKARVDGLTVEHERVRTTLEETRERALRAATEQSELEQRVQALQLEIEALRKRLGDRYQVSLPGLLDRLHMRKRLVLEPPEAVQQTLTVRDTVLEAVESLSITPAFAEDVGRITAMVQEVEQLRETLAALGEVNLAAEEEYLDLSERHTELLAQTEDLEHSVKSIRAAIAKMNRTCRERFRDAYDRVNEAFQSAYPRLVGGGDARLALTDEEDLLETGVDIFVRPPGKRLQNLTLLSGGEKAMTAIALLLALFEVKPSPFCVLDEVDAPLDEANGARFNDMIREMSRLSQFIVITHNRKTMECADVLYGVTMARPGVSTLVSVAFDSEG